MQRRTVLATVASTASLPVVGCLDAAPRAGATFTPHDPEPVDPPQLPDGPEEPPDPPAEITAESVVAYVESFEYAHAYNTLHCRDLRDISVSAAARPKLVTDHGVYAVASARGYAECVTDRGTVSADLGSEPHAYAVGDDYVVRIGDTNATVTRGRDRAYGSDDYETRSAGLVVTNFDHRSHDLDVTVTHEGETAYDDVITVRPHASLTVTSVSAVAGEHELAVETSAGATASGSWTVDPTRLRDRMVRILATGEVAVGRWDLRDLVP